jgi:hypothetical protein
MARILNELRAAEGGFRTTDELVRTAYADHADGGPDSAFNSVQQAIDYLRARGFPIVNQTGRGYRFIPTQWEIADMSDEQPKQPLKRGKMKATDYLPPLEAIRLKRSIEVTEAQRNTAMTALAICEGQLESARAEIAALKEHANKQGEELFKLRGPDPNVPQPNLAGSETVVPG